MAYSLGQSRLMSKYVAYMAMALLLAGSMPILAAAVRSVPVSIVNHSRLPVHATGVVLDQKELTNKLGLPEGSALRLRTVDGSLPVPMTRGMDNGRSAIRLYVSLPPTSRLDLLVEPAPRWDEAVMAQARCDPANSTGVIRNGVLNVTFGKAGWDLAFDDAAGQAGGKILVRGGLLDFWVDNQNRGRIQYGNPKDMGLARYADAAFEKCQAMVAPDGRPTFRIVRRMNGIAKDMTVTETFELVPGLPILLCRVQWHNDGDAPLWIAYVGSGDGVKGKWAKDLMPLPLIERKKSPVMGDLNGGETRPAWLPQLCRISMESPATGCGLGMSTLLPMPNKVGQGSMIWGCGASGFQCNFIDPVQGQFPFLVKPHESLDNGFAFLATQAQTSVYRQTVELWQALQKGSLPALASPCAVYVDGEVVDAQTVSELTGHPELLQASGQARRAALRMDFNRYFQCNVSVEASAQSPVEITARPMAKGKAPISLLRADQPGDYRIDLNKSFPKPDEVAFVLEAKAGGSASLKSLSIAEILPLAPDVLSPVPDASITDLAAMFRWRAIPSVVEYELQLSRSPDFASPQSVRITSSQDSPWYMPPDEKLPAPGKWHWRLRGIKGEILGDWSPVRSFTVNDDHSTRPLKRPLTPRNPLFTLEATRILDYTSFRPDIPPDIAPNVGIIAEGFEGKGMRVTDFARGLEKLPHPIMLRSHWVSLADIEWLCQNVPNFIGIQGGEHLSDLYHNGKDGAMTYAHRLTRICAKYGMLYQEADGTYKDDKWQDLMDRQGAFIRQYGPWLVLSQKNNIIRRQFYSQSAAMGLWLGGIIHQHGAWEDGGFYWQNAGFKGLGQCAGERSGVLVTMPRIWWSLVGVMGISRGCAIYSLDGQTLMVSPREMERPNAFKAGLWDNAGKTTDTFNRFLVPLIRGTLQHELIPTKDQVLKNVKLAVYNDKKTPGDGGTWPHYLEYGPLYATTYGFQKMGNIDGQLWEFFPNTGRYYFIPVLVQGNEAIPGVRNIPVSELQEPAKVKAIFDGIYPQWYQGKALACRIGDTLTVQNTHENEDLTESYAIPLGATRFQALSGRVAPHSYLIGKIEDQGRRLWLQANTEYPERDTQLSITCPAKPQVQVEPATAAREIRWDEPAGRLVLHLSHQQGAVEVTLK